MKVYDTGSAATASLEWNGNGDYWILVDEAGQSGAILTGNTGSKGSEIFPTLNTIVKGGGENRLIDSSITDDGTTVKISTDLIVTGSVITGLDNTITGGDNVSIIGGSGNVLNGSNSVIIGGGENQTDNTTGGGIFVSNNSIVTGGNDLAMNIIGGISNTINSNGGRGVTILGGESNAIRNFALSGDSRTNQSAIIGGKSNRIDDGNNTGNLGSNGQSIILGGIGNNIKGDYTTSTDNFTVGIMVSSGSVITATSRSAIIGGAFNLITGSINSVILGGSGITGSTSNTVYVPNLNVSGSSIFKDNVVISSSLDVTSGITGSLFGTATSASFADTSTSSSFATTASFALNVTPVDTGSFATTGSNTFIGSQVISGSLNVSGSIGDSNIIQNNTDTFTGSAKIFEIVTCTQTEYNTVSGSTEAANTLYVITDAAGSGQFVSGSLTGNVNALTISSQTASLDCSTGNFFTLTLVSGSTTYVDPSNIVPGQTINLRIKQASVASGSIAFAPSVKQVSGSLYTATGTANAEDIITFISFDTSSLYLSNVNNLV